MKEFLKDLNMEIIVNITLFIAGLVLGNWLAIGRDRRKEFNEVADKVHLALKKQKERIESSSVVVSGPEDEVLDKLRRRISFFMKRGFEEALKTYKEARSSNNWKQDEYNQPFYKDPQKVIDSINNLIRYTKRK